MHPSPASLSSFRRLFTANVRRLEEMRALLRDDLNYRFAQLHQRSTEPDAVYLVDSDGVVQMEADFAIRTYLSLRGDTRRMVESANVLFANVQIDDDARAEILRLQERASGLLDEDPFKEALSRWVLELERPALGEPLRRAERAIDGFRSLAQLSVEEDPDLLLDAGTDAMLAADEAVLIANELTSAPRSRFTWEAETQGRHVREIWSNSAEEAFLLDPLLRTAADSLQQTRLLAPAVQSVSPQGGRVSAWDEFPWFSQVARRRWRECNISDGDRERLTSSLAARDLSDEATRAVQALIGELLELWRGPEQAFRAVLSSGFGWPTGGGFINVIPSPQGVTCQEVLVVVSVGAREFRSRLRETIDHLIACADTRVVLFVTDAWDDRYFLDERLSTVDAYSHRGVAFYVLVRIGGVFRFLPMVEPLSRGASASPPPVGTSGSSAAINSEQARYDALVERVKRHAQQNFDQPKSK